MGQWTAGERLRYAFVLCPLEDFGLFSINLALQEGIMSSEQVERDGRIPP